MSDFFVASLGPRAGAGKASENVLDWASMLAPEAPRTPEGWTVPEAFVAIVLSAVTCDGEIAAVEHEELLALVHRSRALKSLSTQQLADLNLKVSARLREEKSALDDACAALPQEMRLAMFAHALDLVLADGELNIQEADFLNALILKLNLDRSGVERVADVITLKNQV